MLCKVYMYRNKLTYFLKINPPICFCFRHSLLKLADILNLKNEQKLRRVKLRVSLYIFKWPKK
jgi:hypothetical protein